jgi:alanyl-tRNA synthetase
VDADRRNRIKKNHTATHLLQKALQSVLGEHVAQQGSYVGPDRLRFDFSHPKAVTPEEIERIETLVNEKIFDNAPAKTTIEDLEAAKKRGVMAMFGEKYEARVRVLDVGGWSLELCGGTHVRAAGDIGPFVILSERAVQAGVRRIEAVTGPAAVEHIQQQRRVLREASQALKASVEEVPARIEQLQTQLKEAKKKSAASAGGDVAASFERLKSAMQVSGEARWAVLDVPDLDLAGVRDLSDRAKSLHPKLAVALFGREEGRVPFVIVCAGLAPKPLNAGGLAKTVSTHLGGGGGGKPDLAQGQGQKPEGVPAAIAAVESAFRAALGSG